MPKPSVNARSLPPQLGSFAKVSAFLVVFFSAIPTYEQWFKALQLDVPFKRVSQAEDQDKLWQENKDCYKQATPIQVKTSTNDALSVTVCPGTGDLLLDVKLPNSQTQITRWIGLRDFEQNSSKSFSAISTATAMAAEAPFEIAQVPVEILCQRFIGPGIVLRRVRYSNGQCFNQEINTYSGLVMSASPAPCIPSC